MKSWYAVHHVVDIKPPHFDRRTKQDTDARGSSVDIDGKFLVSADSCTFVMALHDGVYGDGQSPPPAMQHRQDQTQKESSLTIGCLLGQFRGTVTELALAYSRCGTYVQATGHLLHPHTCVIRVVVVIVSFLSQLPP